MVEWVAGYVQLGTINLTLLLRSQIEHTHGLLGVFSPIAWIAKSLGVGLLPESPSYVWSLQQFQNGFGYMLLDFGWLSVPAFLIAGSIARRIDERATAGPEGPWREAQWTVSYAAASFPVVPAYCGIEFWLQLVMSVALTRSTIRSITRRQRAPDTVVASKGSRSPYLFAIYLFCWTVANCFPCKKSGITKDRDIALE
jgi:hypothetical protein